MGGGRANEVEIPVFFSEDIELLNFKDEIFFNEGRNVTPVF